PGGSARSINLLSSTLTGRSDRSALLKSNICDRSKWDRIVEFVEFGLPKNFPVIARRLGLVDQLPRQHQEIDHDVFLPCLQRLLPIDFRRFGKLRKDRPQNRNVTRIWLDPGRADRRFGGEAFGDRLFRAGRDPAKDYRSNDPAPFMVAQP